MRTTDSCRNCGVSLVDPDGMTSLECGCQEYVGGVLTSLCRKCYVRPPSPEIDLSSMKIIRGGGIPDVFWDGKPEINLADDPRTGQPRTFSSKGEKAAYLRDRGLQEAGDAYHGSPVSSLNTKAKPDSRLLIRESLEKVKKMGRDARRREYNRIIQEGRRYA